MNLLEPPTLFCVVCVLALAAERSPPVVAALACAYAALRVVRSLVDVTCNDVLHRFTAFAASHATLMALRAVVAGRVFSAGPA